MGTLYVVATPIGNLNDMTPRAVEVLKNVNLILCEDTRHSLGLLNYFNIKNRLMAYHKFNEKEKVNEIISYLKSGDDIALITDAGSPCISDPGYILVNEARKEGVNVIGVGGISAVITALSVSGLNTDSFSFYGFFPRENKEKDEFIKNIESTKTNLAVIYESPKRIIKTLEYIYEKLGSVLVSVSKDLTKIHEVNYFGRIENVLEELRNFDKADVGEYVIIIELEVKEEKKENDISTEALLIDTMVKNNVTMKEAIDILNRNSKISKKDIYNASLNLKKL